ncbi:ser thr protein phosphatase family protein [Diplodia corticola]|uniref:Ser thr protein phosphatase family protein n=1 Tax=Diplodia corticola TaxID=236234 RepID=A0A1J9RSF9_9PEZI|nr:ser thr protein phosphatase family protein [Diplodia corticola]OJD35491.1 ser thr protein phosphatase family protein [Diplodia corticola]
MSTTTPFQIPPPSVAAKAQTSRKRSRSRSDSPAPTERPAKRPTPGAEPRPKQPVKFLIMSDTHDDDDDDDEDTDSSFQPLTTTPVDVVLHCGDLTETGTLPSLTKAIRKLSSIPATLRLIIAGNHDITLDEAYYTTACGGSPATHAAALKLVRETAAHHGVTYLDEGTHTFTLPPRYDDDDDNNNNGAPTTPRTFTIYASPWTPQSGASAFQYPSAHDRFNPPGARSTTPAHATNVSTPTSAIPSAGVDVVMTHGPPKYVLDATADGASAGCEHLRRAVCRARPRLCCFGHVHGGYGAQRAYFEGEEEEEGFKDDDDDDYDDDGMVCLPEEFVGRNRARRKGYAEISPGSREEMRKEGQTLMVNAAVRDGEGRARNAPWLVEVEL